jgi:hypothetical protein
MWRVPVRSGTAGSTTPSLLASITSANVTKKSMSSDPAKQWLAVRNTFGLMSVPLHHCTGPTSGSTPTSDPTLGCRPPSLVPAVVGRRRGDVTPVP